MIWPTPSAAIWAQRRRITFGRGSASSRSTRGAGAALCLEGTTQLNRPFGD